MLKKCSSEKVIKKCGRGNEIAKKREKKRSRDMSKEVIKQERKQIEKNLKEERKKVEPRGRKKEGGKPWEGRKQRRSQMRKHGKNHARTRGKQKGNQFKNMKGRKESYGKERNSEAAMQESNRTRKASVARSYRLISHTSGAGGNLQRVLSLL